MGYRGTKSEFKSLRVKLVLPLREITSVDLFLMGPHKEQIYIHFSLEELFSFESVIKKP
jgi:hypothetical protein